MNTIAQYKEKRLFWIFGCGGLLFVVSYLIINAYIYIWLPQWRNLPPLPNGEAGQDFTEVLFRDSIDVVTDQGNYYRCRFLVPGNCWISIPREEPYQEQQALIPRLRFPRVPVGAKKSFVTYHDHDMHYEVFSVIIRGNGRVAIWNQDIDFINPAYNRWWGYFCSGFLFTIGTVVGVFIDLFVNKRWRSKKR